MAKKQKMKPLVTDPGVASYPHLNKADYEFVAEGSFHTGLVQTPEAAARMCGILDAAVAESLELAKKENPKAAAKIKAVKPYKTDHDDHPGMVYTGFKMTENVTPKDKSKEPFSQKPALFDAKGTPLAADIFIGAGSTIRVSFTHFPYYIAKDKEAGIALRLVGVQVIELRKYSGRSAASLGFDAVEDGFDQGGGEFAENERDDSDDDGGNDAAESDDDGDDASEDF